MVSTDDVSNVHIKDKMTGAETRSLVAEPKGSGGCCEELEERLGRRFEARLVTLEIEIAESKRSHEEYVTELKECIVLRDKQLQATLEVVKEKEVTIDTLRLRLEESEGRIGERREAVRELTEQLESNQMKKVAEGKSKPRPKTSYSRVSIPEVAREKPYDKYFVVNVSEVGARQTLCPYKVEKAITKAIAGKPKSIKGLKRDTVLVEVINRKE